MTDQPTSGSVKLFLHAWTVRVEDDLEQDDYMNDVEMETAFDARNALARLLKAGAQLTEEQAVELAAADASYARQAVLVEPLLQTMLPYFTPDHYARWFLARYGNRAWGADPYPGGEPEDMDLAVRLWHWVTPPRGIIWRANFNVVASFEARDWLRRNWSALTPDQQAEVRDADRWYESEAADLLHHLVSPQEPLPPEHYAQQFVSRHGQTPGEEAP